MSMTLHSLFTLYLFQVFINSIHGSASYNGSINVNEAYNTCSKGWFEYDGLCYKVGGTHIKEGVVVETAKQACREENALLATIYNQEISDFISAFLMVPAQRSLWIGLDDTVTEGDYTWADGTPYNFTNFEPNEPSGTRREEEDCIEMVYKTMKKQGNMGQWNDVRCQRGFPYVCQKAKDQQVSLNDRRWMFRNTVAHLELDPRYCMTKKGLGWRFEESCFYLVPEKKNWAEAEDHCSKEYEGHLATLDYRVNYFINYVFREVTEEMWIGVKIKEETQQKWSSGWLVTFENWAEQQTYHNGTCVLLGADGAWLIQSCEKELWFICEYTTSKATAPVLQSTVENVSCPSEPQGSQGWRDFGGDYCYFLGIEASTPWHEATYNCMKKGGTLASIHSQVEMDILFSFVRYYAYYILFIGFYRPTKDANEFVWVDGSPVDFTRWNAGEPNNWNQEEQCAVILVEGMSWNDGQCSSNHGYICSTRKIKTPITVTVPPNITVNPFNIGVFNKTAANNNTETEIPLPEVCYNTFIIYALLGAVAFFVVVSLLCGAALCYLQYCTTRNIQSDCVKLESRYV